MLHVKLTVYMYYTVRFTFRPILFSINLKVTSFRVSFAAGYTYLHSLINIFPMVMELLSGWEFFCKAR